MLKKVQPEKSGDEVFGDRHDCSEWERQKHENRGMPVSCGVETWLIQNMEDIHKTLLDELATDYRVPCRENAKGVNNFKRRAPKIQEFLPAAHQFQPRRSFVQFEDLLDLLALQLGLHEVTQINQRLLHLFDVGRSIAEAPFQVLKDNRTQNASLKKAGLAFIKEGFPAVARFHLNRRNLICLPINGLLSAWFLTRIAPKIRRWKKRQVGEHAGYQTPPDQFHVCSRSALIPTERRQEMNFEI